MIGTDLGTHTVMVRAYADEPVKLLEVRREGESVPVPSRVGASPLVFPSESVYIFDQDRYFQLRAAFETGEFFALSSLWPEVDNAH